MTQYTERQRETKFRKTVKEHNIKCSHCGKNLGKIMEMDIPMPPETYKCYCICGNECYTITTNNKSGLMLDGGYCIADISKENNVSNVRIKNYENG